MIFAFLALVNSLIGFFLFYKGMGLAGVARVSQIQLLQILFTLFFSAIFLGEQITPLIIAFFIVTLGIVVFSKRTLISQK